MFNSMCDTTTSPEVDHLPISDEESEEGLENKKPRVTLVARVKKMWRQAASNPTSSNNWDLISIGEYCPNNKQKVKRIRQSWPNQNS